MALENISVDPDDSNAAIQDIMVLIRQAAAVYAEDDGYFLQALQAEIETIPKANVALVVRDLDWARGMQYGDGATTDADLHAALLTAARTFPESPDLQDSFHTQMRAESETRNLPVYDLS